jgi:hypothetical protein
MTKENIAKDILPDNTLDLQTKNVNVNIDGEIISVIDLEKIFFLTKLNSDPAFIASVLAMDVIKVDKIINNCNFQDIINEYQSEYYKHNAGETIEQLTMRYSDLLKECFTSIRISTGMRIRESISNNKPIDGSRLHIPLIEKIMRLEFALHGVPIDIKGILHKTNKNDPKDKTDDELVKSVKAMGDAIDRALEGGFDPTKFIKENNGVSDAELIEDDGADNKEVKIDSDKVEMK